MTDDEIAREAFVESAIKELAQARAIIATMSGSIPSGMLATYTELRDETDKASEAMR